LAKYDLAIIGSGPGGYNTAIRAAQWGLKTLVIEKDGFLGGTCLHVGCIPTKVLLHHAEIYDNFKNAKEFGIDVKEFALNWPAVLARKEKIVSKHAKGIEFLFRKNKVEGMRGWGRWAGPGRVSVEADGKTTEVEATHIMFATGSAARSLPGIEIDGKIVLSNIEILQLPAVPKTLVIVGAGAVGVEFASIFNVFGTQVTMIEMLPRIVPVEDDDISAELEKALKKKGIQIYTEAKVESVKKDENGDGRIQRQGGQRADDCRREGPYGRGTRAEDGEPGPGKIESEDGARLHPRRAIYGNGRAPAVRDRRYRCRDAAACARRVDGGHHVRGENYRQEHAAN
jgi:dihydrolipoamide dehydrogenase